MLKAKDKVIKMANYNAKLFSDVTGIPINIIDYYDGMDMIGCNKGCSFCRWLEEIIHMQIDCRKVATKAGVKSIKYHGKHVFFCRTGFIHFASPITLNDELIATAVGGPIVVRDSSESVAYEIMERYNIPQSVKEETIKRIISIPNLSPDIIAKSSELLKIMVNFVFHQNNLASSYSYPMNYFQLHETELELVDLIAKGNSEKAHEVINNTYYTIVKFLEDDFDSIKNLCFELTLILSRIASDYGRKNGNIYGEKYQYLKIMEKIENKEELEQCLRIVFYNFIETAFESQIVKHNEVILRTIDYIKQNYMTKITLDSAASYVFLSPSYLSKIFKEEVGNNFNNYLNTVRIENAKKLLVNDNINLVNIASLVGYEDQSYFSKVFKRVTGMTPKKYKESRGVLKKQKGKSQK